MLSIPIFCGIVRHCSNQLGRARFSGEFGGPLALREGEDAYIRQGMSFLSANQVWVAKLPSQTVAGTSVLCSGTMRDVLLSPVHGKMLGSAESAMRPQTRGTVPGSWKRKPQQLKFSGGMAHILLSRSKLKPKSRAEEECGGGFVVRTRGDSEHVRRISTTLEHHFPSPNISQSAENFLYLNCVIF